MSKISFKIVNKTEDRFFRFEWSQHSNIVLSPSIGHLSPCESKEITATFLALEHTKHHKVIYTQNVSILHFILTYF